MASAILAQSNPTAITNTTVYTVPASNYAIMNISIANRATTAITVRVAVAAAAAPTTSEWIEYDTTIPGNGVLERTGVATPAGKLIVVYVSAANASVSVYGILQAV